MVPERQPVKQTQYEIRNQQLRQRVAEVPGPKGPRAPSGPWHGPHEGSL